MKIGNRYHPNKVGDERPCSLCGGTIVVTEAMIKCRTYRCGPCKVKVTKDYVEKNREKKREWTKAYCKRNPDIMSKHGKLYRSRHPEKRKATLLILTEIRSGRLTPMPCEVCGTIDNLEAHHDDYTQPLAIRWLCHIHHSEHHKLAMLLARKEGGE